MHARFYNELTLAVRLRPRTPLLIKAGGGGEEALDPTLPHMAFVRTTRPGEAEPELYIPGSSLRGVVRSHAEKLLRSLDEGLACDPTRTGKPQRFAVDCLGAQQVRDDESEETIAEASDEPPGPRAYNGSCYACRLFGNTVLASRVRVGDLALLPEPSPLLQRRYHVAIDRVTGAVANGPFELEILTDALFEGQLVLRNVTLGQLGLLAGALLDVGDGLVPLGYGKSRGMGRVELTVQTMTIRTLRDPNGALLGVGALATGSDGAYRLPPAEAEWLSVGADSPRWRGFYTMQADGEEALRWLEALVPRWLEQAPYV